MTFCKRCETSLENELSFKIGLTFTDKFDHRLCEDCRERAIRKSPKIRYQHFLNDVRLKYYYLLFWYKYKFEYRRELPYIVGLSICLPLTIFVNPLFLLWILTYPIYALADVVKHNDLQYRVEYEKGRMKDEVWRKWVERLALEHPRIIKLEDDWD